MEALLTPAAFDLATLKAALGDHACRFDADAVAECDSTNARLLNRAESGAPSGSVLVADNQTAGRGRRGRIWHSGAGESLTFSLLWRFPLDSSAPQALSLAVGLAVARALRHVGAPGIGLKWPNDVLHEQRKLGGILIELVSGETRGAVIGIGLNLREPPGLPEDLREVVTALDRLCSPLPGREAILAALLIQLAETLDIYAAHSFAVLRDQWQALHVFHGRMVRLLSEHASDLHGRCLGVGEDGALLLDTDAGRRQIIAGEISLRPA